MAGTSQQPSRVATSDTPPERPANVVTDETEALRAKDPTAAPPDQGGQKTDDPASPDDKSSKSRRDRSAERKIARLTKRLSESQNNDSANRKRIEALEREIEELKAGRTPPPKPARKDFDSDEAYARAFAKWDSTHGDGKQTPGKKADEPGQQRTRKPASEEEQRAAPNAEEIKAFKEAGTKKLGDEFLEAYQNPNDVAVNQAMGDFILDSDLGPELYVWLFNNPEEARKLYYKSETAVVRRLEKLEKQIKEHGTWDFDEGSPAGDGKGKGDQGKGKRGEGAEGDGGKGSGRTRRSNAPDPPDSDDRGNLIHEKSLEDADMDEYAEIRRRQIKKSGAPLL